MDMLPHLSGQPGNEIVGSEAVVDVAIVWKTMSMRRNDAACMVAELEVLPSFLHTGVVLDVGNNCP
uniref:Uncharacterized protein n=1 Tax=Leersia perrieri TaxID=77586 RepID=A0A0D9Y1G1_9ORYZ